MVLSEKAKGKQRAVDPEINGPPDSRDLTIRFTEGIPDLILHVVEKDTVRDVKSKVRISRPQLCGRRLRLIHAGRLLTDGIRLHPWLTALEEKQRRVTPTSEEPHAPVQSSMITWLHCSVGPVVERGTESEEKPQVAQIQPLRGFDRLATAGFSEEDIAHFRRQFHSQSSANYLDLTLENDDDDYDEHARALEEQWIDSLDNANNCTACPIVIAVFWDDGTQVEATESVIFSRKTQVGIVFGFLANVLFGTWRYLLDPS
ncbi:DUF2407 ubiquitin-like domain-containing protein [Pisolithus orientalis]|uniref:DUF2407 ubiquitin-like domain-containing protein n=1 Tax=Pisolithus orientalis TaxID=936130 RepID=UPI0022249000|nr:DUF2407 ubiquitin-like domain-containing protein [Pisolithus orientalis]KAI6030441.1 DUF2407 ubiquitin-like domain-containing protein [Pisolithus orientalis]